MNKIITLIYLISCIYTASPSCTEPCIHQNMLPIFISAEISPLNMENLHLQKFDLYAYFFEGSSFRDIKQKGGGDLNLYNAVLRLQSAFNLPVDGIIKETTLNLINKLALQDLPLPEDIIQKPPSQKKWLAVNVDRRILTLYEGTFTIRRYPLAVGNPTSLTPQGKFLIVNKAVDPAWSGGDYSEKIKGGTPENPLGSRWMGLSHKGGYVYGIHGNNNPFSIGKNISKGCIRMINSDVEELFSQISINTPVWIGSDELLEQWGVIQSSIQPGNMDQQ